MQTLIYNYLLTYLYFQNWKLVHLSTVIAIFTWVVFFKCLAPGKDYRIPLDLFIYVILYSAIPFAHWIWLQEGGLGSWIVQAKMKQAILPFVNGGIGLIFYLTRFPEKMFKGSVDLVGASHQVGSMILWVSENYF